MENSCDSELPNVLKSDSSHHHHYLRRGLTMYSWLAYSICRVGLEVIRSIQLSLPNARVKGVCYDT